MFRTLCVSLSISLVACGKAEPPDCKTAVGSVSKRLAHGDKTREAELSMAVTACVAQRWTAAERSCVAAAETPERVATCLAAHQLETGDLLRKRAEQGRLAAEEGQAQAEAARKQAEDAQRRMEREVETLRVKLEDIAKELEAAEREMGAAANQAERDAAAARLAALRADQRALQGEIDSRRVRVKPKCPPNQPLC